MIALEPYTFNGAYANCYAIPEVCMDRRHVFIMHEILCAWRFKSALEIGSFNGASATAFVEAINQADTPDLATFCDIRLSESLVRVVQNCKDRNRVRLTQDPSVKVLRSTLDFEFVFVDGCHDLDSVKPELDELLRRRPLCVMAHDTNASFAGYPKCEGAAMLAETFRRDKRYGFVEDFQKRAGERTERGLFFATTDYDLHGLAVEIFQRNT